MSRSECPELKDLVEELHGVKKKWYDIGIQLKVPDDKLDEIESTDQGDVKRAFRRMIREWLKQIEPKPTWAGLVEALRSRSVDEVRLAENLKRRYCATPAAISNAPHDATDSSAVAIGSANTASGSEQVQDPAVRKEMEELHRLFEQLRIDVYNFLSKQLPDLNEFRVFVSSPPPAWKMKRQKPLIEVDLDRIMKADKFHEIYIVLSQYMNWYNYELLNSIVEKYANPLIKKKMKDYRIRLDDFEQRTSLDVVENIPLCQPQSDSVALNVRMPYYRCNQFRLSEIRIMKHKLADEAGIDHATLRTHMIATSSVKIIFLVPLALAPYLMVRSIPLLTSQDLLPENVDEKCVHVIHTEEAFRLMGRSLPPPRPALPAPPRQRTSISLSSSCSSEPQPKPMSVLVPNSTLDPRHVQVFHGKVLDRGASTVVCEAHLSHLPCVAKYVHTKLVESDEWPLEKFLEGCKFLESCRHPNIITFLGMYYDESLNIPILLMEKMDQSLHNYLEQATHPIPIHAQLDICHDIAQGLEYIHSREYIHGDLTATNILLQGRRAKIGGMMTLQCKSPDVELSLCPGPAAYMPMRSFSSSDYNESIDCFSFGVIATHIATGEMPSPTSQVTEPSLEVERYSESITKMDMDHPMHLIILRCLRDESNERPLAADLCTELSAMKEASAYKTSILSETLQVRLLNLQNHFVRQKLQEKKEELNLMKQQHQARLQEEREAIRQEISEDAEKEIESVRSQTKAETEKMEANFQKEKEKLSNAAKCELNEAREKTTKLEQDLKRKIQQIMSACEEEKEELKTNSERAKQDMQDKLRQLELDKQQLRGKLEEADQSYARLLQASASH